MGNHKQRSAKLPSCPATTADDADAMSVPIQTPTTKRNSRPKYPLYGNAELNLILRFLAAYLTEFQTKLASERAMAKGSENVKIFAGRVKFREHQVSTIMELVKRAYWPQKHLALVSDAEIEERIRTCLQP